MSKQYDELLTFVNSSLWNEYAAVLNTPATKSVKNPHKPNLRALAEPFSCWRPHSLSSSGGQVSTHPPGTHVTKVGWCNMAGCNTQQCTCSRKTLLSSRLIETLLPDIAFNDIFQHLKKFNEYISASKEVREYISLSQKVSFYISASKEVKRYIYQHLKKSKNIFHYLNKILSIFQQLKNFNDIFQHLKKWTTSVMSVLHTGQQSALWTSMSPQS